MHTGPTRKEKNKEKEGREGSEKYLSNRRILVDQHLETILEDHSREPYTKLAGAMSYTVLNGGKRIRPILALAVYELFDTDVSKIIESACVMELIHSASLMLDDLPCMDNATLRRGKKTNHLVYGEATTILAGIALFALSFKLLSKIQSGEIHAIVKETAESIGHIGLIRGQFLDIESFQKPQTLSELRQCYFLKTGILFQNAVKIGAFLGRASEKHVATLAKFGRDFGLAYQIRDDIVDTESSSEKTGKDTHSDQKNKKMSYMTILGKLRAKKILGELIEKISQDLKSFQQTSGLDTRRLGEITEELKLS